MGSVHSEVEGIPVAANPCREIAVHLESEIERIIANSERFVPG